MDGRSWVVDWINGVDKMMQCLTGGSLLPLQLDLFCICNNDVLYINLNMVG